MAPNFQENCLCTLLRAGVFVAGCTILVVAAFPVVQIVMGVVYMGSCPLSPVLPVHLLVSGVGALLIMSLLALPHLLCPERHTNSLWTLWMISLGLLYLVWFLYGSYLIYSVYPPQYTDSPSIPRNSTSNAVVSSGPGPTPSGASVVVSSGPGPTPSGASVVVSSGPGPTPSGASVVVSSGPGPTPSGASVVVSSGPGPTPSGPSVEVSSGQRPTHSGPSAVVSSGQRPTRAGLSAVLHSHRTGSSVGGPSTAVNSGLHCHRSMYLFAFWSHTLVYVFAGNALVLLLCLCCFMKVSDLVVKHLTT